MKTKVLATLFCSVISQTCFADCDFSLGISKLEDGRFAYSQDCHRTVGKLVADQKDWQTQVEKLNKAIEAKDVDLSIQQKRADNWMETSLKLEDRVEAIDKYKSTTSWLYYAGGILTGFVAVWAAGQLRN